MTVFKVTLTGFEKSPCFTSDIQGLQNIIEAYFGENLEWVDMKRDTPMMVISIEEMDSEKFDSLEMHEIFD